MLGRQNADAEFDAILANAGAPGRRAMRRALSAFFCKERRPALYMSIVLVLLMVSSPSTPMTIVRTGKFVDRTQLLGRGRSRVFWGAFVCACT